MEYALREDSSQGRWPDILCVLILVLMEYALRAWQFDCNSDVLIVLILVLMEYALRANN